MKKEKNKKQSSKKEEKNLITGYIKIILIFSVTIFLVLLLRNWYISRVNYQLNIPIIKETLIQEINGNEIYNYVRENETAVIYMGVVTDQECREFEEDFNEVIKEKNLETTITYLNLTEEKKVNKFIKEFNKFYSSDLDDYPAIIIFEDGSIKDIISNGKNKLTKESVVEFLNENNIKSEEI